MMAGSGGRAPPGQTVSPQPPLTPTWRPAPHTQEGRRGTSWHAGSRGENPVTFTWLVLRSDRIHLAR